MNASADAAWGSARNGFVTRKITRAALNALGLFMEPVPLEQGP